MKKIIVFCLLVFMVGMVTTAPCQSVKIIPTITLSSTDTLTGTQTKTFERSITGNYNWAVSIFYDHLSGADTCSCYIQESVDATHYITVAGATTASFLSADATFIWSGGTGNLPVVWPTNYLRISCTHHGTGTARPYVKLNLKNK